MEEGAETDLDQGVKRGLINLEENDLLDMGRDCWEDEEEVDGLRLTTGGRGGGGTGMGVGGKDSVGSKPRDSSRWISSSKASGSGTTGRGANLIFLDWAGLVSSSGGRMESLRAGEFGRGHGELRGEGLKRIDCRIGFAIVFERGRRGERVDEDEEEG